MGDVRILLNGEGVGLLDSNVGWVAHSRNYRQVMKKA
jgi:hypothetical protein